MKEFLFSKEFASSPKTMVWIRLGKTDLLFRCAEPLFWERKQIPWRKVIPSFIGTDWISVIICGSRGPFFFFVCLRHN